MGEMSFSIHCCLPFSPLNANLNTTPFSPLFPPSKPKPITSSTLNYKTPPPYSSLIQSCIDSGSFAHGKSIHTQMLASGFMPDSYLHTKILMLYARSGDPADIVIARQLFDEMPARNSTSWNTIIIAYARVDDHLNVIHLFSQMRKEGILPDRFTFPSIVKACSALNGAVAVIPQLHCLIIKSEMNHNVVVGSTLIDGYVTLGLIDDAVGAFNEIDGQNSIAWNGVLGGYANTARWEDAWEAFCRMQEAGLSPDHFTLATAVRACAGLRLAAEGEKVHGRVIILGYQNDVFVGNTLIDMYAKCGDEQSCAAVFEQMRERNQVTWNSMISSYTFLGYYQEALRLFSTMQKLGFECDRFNLGSGLMACAATGDIETGCQFHGYLVRRFLDSDLVLGSAVVDMYAKSGLVEEAHRVFDRLAERNEVSWNALIAGYAQEEELNIAVELYKGLRYQGITPDQFTFANLLTVSANQGNQDLGKQIHAHIIRTEARSNIVLQTELVHMYSKCGRLRYAEEIFSRMPERNAYSWNTLIKGFEQNSRAIDALQLFIEMQLNSITPNSFSLASVLSACTGLSDLSKGKEIHGYMVKNMLEDHNVLRCLLVALYAECENLEYACKTYKRTKRKDVALHNVMIKSLTSYSKIAEARRVFDQMEERSVVSWNLILMGYAKTGLKDEIFEFFRLMVEEGVEYDCSSLVPMFNFCSSVPALEQGKQLHAAMVKKGLTHSSVLLDSAVVDLYAKAGSVKEARSFFDRMKERNVVTWNTMISGYGRNGQSREALALFEHMKKEKIELNDVTFLSVLSACSHTGLVDEGISAFISMLGYRIEPRTEHYTCMVDLLGRAGRLKEAKELIGRMPVVPDVSTWGALLGACRIHKEVNVGRFAADNLFRLDPKNSGHYVLMANIYAAAGKWKEADGVRELTRGRTVKKESGVSWIEIENETQMFYAGEQSHPKMKEIRAALGHLCTDEKREYVPYSDFPEL